MPGTIRLYEMTSSGIDLQVEIAYYYDVSNRKKIVDYWYRTYGENLDCHYIQVAPKFNFRKKIKFGDAKIV